MQRAVRFAFASLLLVACGPPAHPGTTVAAHAGTASSSPAPGESSASPHGPASLVAACHDAPLLVPNETIRATTAGRRDLFHATCAYGAASPDAVYRVHLDAPSHVSLRVTGGYDTVVSLRAACLDDDSEIACNDDAPDESHSAVDADVPAGDYFAIVDGFASGHAGFYTLTMRTAPAPAPAHLAFIARVAVGLGATVEHTAGATGPVTGTVEFAKRHVTPHGLSRGTTREPSAHTVVEALDADGRVLATAETDDHGAFTLPLAAGSAVRVRALSRTSFLGNDIRVVSDPGTERPYEVSTLPITVQGGEHVALFADVGGVEPAGAFNILAQFVRYLPFVQRGFGHPLAPLYAFWRRGNNNALPQGNITAFLLSYHRHDGSFALQIQGGAPGREDASDSDQFDDPVILHEFTHFVIHTMAGDFSIAGTHQDHELHFPGQALDEGAATAIGCAVVADARYWDTAGLEPSGRILVDDDSESMSLPDRGIGSQNSAITLVWDMIDGAEGVPDVDHDGVAIGLTNVMRIFASFHDDPLALPGIHTVLERAVEMHLMTAAQASRLVHFPIDQGFSFPLPASSQWPHDLVLPAETTGRVDGLSQPAPSGGRNIPANGFDAVQTYRLHLDRRGMVYLDLEIDGAGTVASQTNLILEVVTRNLRPVPVRVLRSANARRIHQIMEPGTYIVLVRDDGRGNRAGFTLRARQSHDFH